ncbi:MAG: NAD-dependent epimerase/dehydratase family protein [Planctomycetota bacterium]|nr:NAD-dependent epimerase/dehydratase family protein [Planctomycetota bacterium]
MERILITGGAGYIGTALTPMLLERGHHVTIYDNFMYGAEPLFGFCTHRNLKLVKADVRDGLELSKAVKDHDWILHLAAIVGYPACAADPRRAHSTNVDGTRNVLMAMSRGQRLVFASTGSTYGKVEGIATEETPIAPLTLYGQNKRDGEKLVRDSGLDHVTLRFATVFGPSPRLRLDLLVNDFVYQAIHNRQIILYEGHFRRTFLHSYDAAASYPFTMANFDKMKGQVFNVGDTSMNFTKREIAEHVRKYANFYLHEADVGHDLDQRDYEVDYSKLAGLGYKASFDLDTGIQQLVQIFSVFSTQDPLRNA